MGDQGLASPEQAPAEKFCVPLAKFCLQVYICGQDAKITIVAAAKVYTRSEIEQLIKERRIEMSGSAWRPASLQEFCKQTGLYYHGLHRFLKGADCSIESYFKFLNAVDPQLYKVPRHYLAARLNYSDLQELRAFCKEIFII